MKVKILETKSIGHKTWYLCKGNLLEYLQELKDDFYDYAIQRKIVKNQYLDKLYSTIKEGDPISVLTLTYKGEQLDVLSSNEAVINLASVEILDGLQRSFRLWAHWYISKKYNMSDDYRTFAKELKSENPLFFDSGVISTQMLKRLIETNEINEIDDVFSDYDIYFTIWTGLTEKDIIQKMLILNAGQKSVSKTHQFELLFLHFYNKIDKEFLRVKLFREKDANASDVKRGNRRVGEFMFSSVIVALQSFVEGKPLRVTLEKLIENEFDENETSDNSYDIVFNNTFVTFYLFELRKLDNSISAISKGKDWFSKDTTLSGVLAGIGKYINTPSITNENQLKDEAGAAFDKLIARVLNYGFKLEKFTEQYNNLSSRSVNIGYFIRKVIMEYTYSLLKDENPEWDKLFKSEKEV